MGWRRSPLAAPGPCCNEGGSAGALLFLRRAPVRRHQSVFWWDIWCRWDRDGSGNKVAHPVTGKNLRASERPYASASQFCLKSCCVTAQLLSLLGSLSSFLHGESKSLIWNTCALSAGFVPYLPLLGHLMEAEWHNLFQLVVLHM